MKTYVVVGQDMLYYELNETKIIYVGPDTGEMENAIKNVKPAEDDWYFIVEVWEDGKKIETIRDDTNNDD